jgi:hypothetical protein
MRKTASQYQVIWYQSDSTSDFSQSSPNPNRSSSSINHIHLLSPILLRPSFSVSQMDTTNYILLLMFLTSGNVFRLYWRWRAGNTTPRRNFSGSTAEPFKSVSILIRKPKPMNRHPLLQLIQTSRPHQNLILHYGLV